MILGTVDIWNHTEFQRMSRQLDLFSRGDFSALPAEIAAVYPNTPDFPVRKIPFTQRYIDELAGLYHRTVVRRFGPNAGPQALSDPQWQKLQAVYDASALDSVLANEERNLWTQNSALLVPVPAGLGRVRLISIQPWQIERIDTDDAMHAADPATWTQLIANVPVANVWPSQVTYGRLTLTRERATRYVGATETGIYSDNKTHPFGTMPVIVAHRVRPDPGRPLPPVNEPVLNLQIALCLGEADSELIVRHCAFPQKWIENATIAQQVESVTVGPDKVMALVRSGDPTAPGPALRIAQGQVPVSELVSLSEHQIRLYCAMLNLDPSVFLRVNTAVTAAARLFSSQDRAATRNKILPVLAQLEADLAQWIVRVLALREPMAFPDSVTVGVTYQMADPAPDPQSAAQALKAGIEVGIDSPIDAVMARDGIGQTQAQKVVEGNLASSRALGLIPPMPATGPVAP